MEKFRNLTKNIFFKIILGFVALSFVLFGVSGFILGNPNDWVAKIGNSKISVNKFNVALKNDREIIFAKTDSEEAIKYSESDQFKQVVLNRLVGRELAQKLVEEADFKPNRELVFRAIAKDQTFKGEDGKFDKNKFQNFLTNNGLDEKRYIEAVENNIVNSVISQSVAAASIVNEKAIIKLKKFENDQRVADIIVVSAKNIKNIKEPNKEEISEYYKIHKDEFIANESREISYISFSRKNFINDLKVTEQEIENAYKSQKDRFLTEEKRDLYHIVFEEEKEAENFIEKVKSEKNIKDSFVKFAKEIKGKNVKDLLMANVKKRSLPAEISKNIFALNKGEIQKSKSALGFHAFYILNVQEPELIPLKEVKAQIQDELSKDKEDNLVISKIKEIDESLITTNSLSKTAQKFNLGKISEVKIVKNENNKIDKKLSDFSKNAFIENSKQVSKIYFSNATNEYYIIKINKINEEKIKELSEVKNEIILNLKAEKRTNELRKLASEINAKLDKSPEQASQIAKKYNLDIQKNKKFPRRLYLDSGNGQKIPYQNQFLNELFAVNKINELTSLIKNEEGNYIIGILKEIIKNEDDSKYSGIFLEESEEKFKQEILQEFNRILLKKYPIKINENFFRKN